MGRDPWEEDSKDNGRQTKQSKYNQEFHGEDDEGYEGESSMRSKQRGKNKFDTDYDDLLAPKPLGGSGSDSKISSKSSFFGRDQTYNNDNEKGKKSGVEPF